MGAMSLLAMIMMFALWTTNEVSAGTEEAAVQQVITDLAQAVAAFPQSKDRQSILKFFAKDFSSVDDAEWGSVQDIETMLKNLERELSRAPLTITNRASHIVVHIAGTFAWATYDEILTIEGEQVTVDDAGLCTAILTKTTTGWLYQHEHCSSSRTQQNPAIHETSSLAGDQITNRTQVPLSDLSNLKQSSLTIHGPSSLDCPDPPTHGIGIRILASYTACAPVATRP
jgi:ketosteroid isomerase-like protein